MTWCTASAPEAVLVLIEDVTAPATFPHLPAAVGALWEALRALPLGSDQYEAYKVLLGGPDAVERVSVFMERDGQLRMSFWMDGRSHLVTVAPAGEAVSQ